MKAITEPRVLKWTLGDRLGKALRNEHVSKQEMAELLGVTRNTVGNYIADRTPISDGYIRLWSVRTKVSFEELKYGDDEWPESPLSDSNRRPPLYKTVGSDGTRPRIRRDRPTNRRDQHGPNNRAA